MRSTKRGRSVAKMEKQVPIFEQLSRPSGKEQSPKDKTRMKLRLLLFGGLEGAKVKKSKTYFEQIPVEVVKKIVKERPAQIEEEEMRNGKGALKTPNRNTEPALRTGGFACSSGKLGECLHRRDWQQPLQETPFESDGGLRASSAESPMPDPSTAPPEDWRELAQRVQVENDPNKMVELVEQLIAKIDEERLPKPFRPTSQTQ